MNAPAFRRASRLNVIDSQGRKLLFRHARHNEQMFWATPGGGLEPGETFEHAALREAGEELGITRLAITFLWEQMTDFVYIDRLVPSRNASSVSQVISQAFAVMSKRFIVKKTLSKQGGGVWQSSSQAKT